MIELTPQGGADRKALRTAATRLGLVVTATEPRLGTLEGYAPLAALRSIAALPDVGTVVQAVKPVAAAGSVRDQGVAFQNVDKVLARGINGAGVTIGALSDSYDTATSTYAGTPLKIHASQDIASGDLPGPGNPQNSLPVKVLQDFSSTAAYDEGRAMLQIAHDVAPKASLCFATAFTGEVQFANNIRRLADPRGDCRADVVVDDVRYFDEPYFSDGILSDAVDDVAAQGVQYFSSAQNSGDHQAWRAPIDLVPSARATVGTNLDLSSVPADLYDGGLEDFDPGPGVDTAQTYAVGASGGVFDLQWDDPTDYAGPTLGRTFFTGGGHLSLGGTTDVPLNIPASRVGQQIQVVIDGVPSGGPDLILTVLDPSGGILAGPIDTGYSPEKAVVTPVQAGQYTIRVQGFDDAVDADFTATARRVLRPSKVTDDFNVLFFDSNGHYLGAQADINSETGRPTEIAGLAGLGHVQIAIGRSGTGPLTATTLAQVAYGDVYVDEYFDPTAPATVGHPTAAGAVGVSAIGPFKPYLPEFFTSPGGIDLPISYDSDGNRYPHVQRRTSPLISSTDGANTTFFVSDSVEDSDTFPNFYGTSAAAPHAASIAALVLQAHGGRRSVTPFRMRAILRSSTFSHDLDPAVSTAKAGDLTVVARGTSGPDSALYHGSQTDPSFFRVSYSGKVPLASMTFFGATASPSALGRGIVFDPRPYTTDPRVGGSPFAVGSTSGGLRPASVSATFTGAGGGASQDGQYSTMTVRFDNGLHKDQSVSFGVDRDLQTYAPGLSIYGNGADDLGGAVLLPSGAVIDHGLEFQAVRTDGTAIEGRFVNRLGRGYSPVDGYGLLDAGQAVLGFPPALTN